MCPCRPCSAFDFRASILRSLTIIPNSRRPSRIPCPIGKAFPVTSVPSQSRTSRQRGCSASLLRSPIFFPFLHFFGSWVFITCIVLLIIISGPPFRAVTVRFLWGMQVFFFFFFVCVGRFFFFFSFVCAFRLDLAKLCQRSSTNAPPRVCDLFLHFHYFHSLPPSGSRFWVHSPSVSRDSTPKIPPTAESPL